MAVQGSVQKKSLHDIMNDMVRAPATLVPPKPVLPGAEIDAFAALDPLLAGLRKQMLDAQSYFQQLKKKNGKNDPMTAVAADMADSAGAAFETRLIELRRDHFKCRAMRRLLKQAEEEAREKRLEAALQYQMRLQAFFLGQKSRQKQEGLRREERERQNWIVFLIWILQMNTEMMGHSLARRFTLACSIEEAA